MVGIALLTILFVALDFSFNKAEPPDYRFVLPELTPNRPVLLRQQSLLLIVARFDAKKLDELNPSSRVAAISQSFRSEVKRVDDQGYFVAFGYGAQSCPLEIREDGYREVCSEARYDLLGRSLDKQNHSDLEIPRYTFSQNHSVLTVE